MRLLLFGALLLLTLQLGLLFALHLGHPFHPSGTFARLLFVFFQFGQQLLFVP